MTVHTNPPLIFDRIKSTTSSGMITSMFIWKIFLVAIAVLFLSLQKPYAQSTMKMYGMTGGGIFSMSTDGSDFITASSFFFNGRCPKGKLIEGSDGRMYGITSEGTQYRYGMIYSILKNGTDLKRLRSFYYDQPSQFQHYPTGSLIEGSDGKLYGMIMGEVFSIEKDGTGYSTLKDVGDSFGGVIEGSDGKLYGMAYTSGDYHWGIIFSISKDGTDYSEVFIFQSMETGLSPWGDLMEGSNGKLYGMTTSGGDGSSSHEIFGIVFSILKDGTEFTVLHRFNETNGKMPTGSLIEGSDGKLYGMASRGGSYGAGVIFSILHDGTDFLVLHNFQNEFGDNPLGSLIEGSNGKLYGMTRSGGNYDNQDEDFNGVAFSIAKNGSGYTVIKKFDDVTGSRPFGSLMEASDGRLYGVASEGGSSARGVFFSMSHSGSGYTALHNFEDFNGSSPYGSVTIGRDGKLYGMTSKGGKNDHGVVFSVLKDGSGYTVIQNFNRIINGAWPHGNLIDGSDGRLYGMTSDGGNSYGGVIFSILKNGTESKVLHNFQRGIGAQPSNGFHPYGSLIEGSDGKLYGMARDRYSGSSEGAGVIFSISKDGTGYTVLQEFKGANGWYPLGSLIEGSDGKLYGMTKEGGSGNCGVIFSISKNGAEYSVIYNLNYNDGCRPRGSLMEGSDGKLYGMTYDRNHAEGDGDGVIFSVSKDGSGYTVLQSLVNDGYASGDLTEGPDGKLYGMTRSITFSISRNGTDYTHLRNLGAMGGHVVFEKEPQTITFDNIESRNYGDRDFTLTAAASSGLPVTYSSSNPDVATITDNTVTILKWGTTTITAYQVGNINYSSALAVQQILTVNNIVGTKNDQITEIKVFGNPFKGQLTIQIDTPSEYEVNVSLVDLVGKQVYQSIERANEMIVIEKQIAAGTYLLKIKTHTASKVIRVVKSDF